MTENESGTPQEPTPDRSVSPMRHSFETSQQPDAGHPAASAQPGGASAPQYGYPQAPPKNDLGVWALVTGILGYVMCPLVLGIAAIITGTKSRRAADEGLANNRGMGTAGLILGWINVVLALLGIALVIFVLGSGLVVRGFDSFNDMTASGY